MSLWGIILLINYLRIRNSTNEVLLKHPPHPVTGNPPLADG